MFLESDMPERPRALVIRSAGTNCDGEMCRAFDLAGAWADLVHLDRLIAEPQRIAEYDLIGFPGGFSYGDDIAAGRVMAVKVRERLHEPLREAADRGVLMIGACNGFQALVQTGLLPGRAPGEWPADRLPPQSVALAANADGRFIDQWLRIEPVAESVCLWTKGLNVGGRNSDEGMMLPIAHGEGRLVAASDTVLDELEQRGQVALRYIDNANGSQRAIAGICDPSGRIFGLMPHPERFLDWSHHPYWTRLAAGHPSQTTIGLRMFRNAVEAVASAGVRVP